MMSIAQNFLYVTHYTIWRFEGAWVLGKGERLHNFAVFSKFP